MNHRIFKHFPIIMLSAMLCACGPDGGDSESDAAVADASAQHDLSGLAPGQCTDLVNASAPIPETAGGVFASPEGGAVADGTYVLTSFEIFPPGSIDPYQRRHTLRVTGDHIEIVTQTDQEPERRMSATMTLSGDQVQFAVDCPQATSYGFGYTATDTQFIHIVNEAGTKEIHTYTRQ